MKIGELSRRTGISIRMLRYYETEGLLSPVRTQSGYRDYSHADVETVGRIGLLSDAGMTLAVIRQFLPCSLDRRHAFEPCDELKSQLHTQISSIDEKSRKLSESRNLLAGLLKAFEESTPT
ncbi:MULTISPECIES: MerR family transcriptional regulator [Rhizobium/Agrobacterium group]|jgi:DNA-binding transcriptional MerR regulator|uniref:MerR family transcriptional regulator n=2 Tax=Rhizobium/Agrobacterium group TaxID=227290 RepID=A0A546X1A0_RHIRH|nr:MULTISPECIES: MerR family transcriptional regulator [Rhizobium/Agrobacterium group]MCZ7467322.1 MerR family transcriptional regulator [Rhizobium rhizogenes]MCZ7469180.1 MerR family transcriptional regulator [Rhizobium rhizogenes]MCZ7483113.1 MerR family transcriptional regulator [Rhizobium rhizogenes]MCZ7488825.1 MerR family transcriptional regulator [Rhizobium rhizogenes]MDO3443995.1 MerR family transcriptional regulator [Agrobacterium sp. V1]